MKSQGILRKDFRYNEKLRKPLFDHIDSRVKRSISRRIDMINDPKDVLESMYMENFSLEKLDFQIKRTMAKLGFKIPDKLIVPAAMFYFCNAVASKI